MFLCRVPYIGHSVKPLPSVTSALDKKKPTSTLTASLPSVTSAALGKEFFLFFLKIFCRVPYSCTRQRNFFFLKKIFAECHGSGTRQSWEIGSLLPSFAECHGHGTRQSPLCRVWHSAKKGKCYFFVFCFPSAQTKKSHIYQHTAQDISHTHPYSITYTSITHHIHIHHP